jgi:hypothetical protein
VSFVSNIERHVVVSRIIIVVLEIIFKILKARGTNRANVPEVLSFADISLLVSYTVSYWSVRYQKSN